MIHSKYSSHVVVAPQDEKLYFAEKIAALARSVGIRHRQHETMKQEKASYCTE